MEWNNISFLGEPFENASNFSPGRKVVHYNPSESPNTRVKIVFWRSDVFVIGEDKIESFKPGATFEILNWTDFLVKVYKSQRSFRRFAIDYPTILKTQVWATF